MTSFVLDTSAIVAWVIQEQSRWKAVDTLIANPASEPVLPAPALTESIVVARKRGNTSTGAELLLAFQASGIRIEACQIRDLLRAAAILEASRALPRGPGRAQTVSFCDALILAMTERLDLPVLTGDRYWQHLAAERITTATVVLL